MITLVSGAAGFIGFHVANKILQNKKNIVIGIDNLNSYYDVKLKKKRLSILKNNNNFFFKKVDISNLKSLEKVFNENKIKIVINLAAQAGVRYSIKNPNTYLESNIIGFYNIINLSRIYKIKHFLYASTSSVYGTQNKFPLKEDYSTDKPLSFYAATKKCNEIIAHSYSNIYGIPTTGFRFFTVYGPYGRPDMALFKFATNIKKNNKIKLYNFGKHERDFTYITDIVEIVTGIMRKPSKNKIPFEIYNIGGNKSHTLKYFISLIEKNLNLKARFLKLPLQKGDVRRTQASTNKIDKLINKKEYIKIEIGIKKFFEWLKKHEEFQ